MGEKKMLCGGTSEFKQPDDEANRVLDVAKAALLTQTGHDGDVQLIGYKSQLVAGINYFLKVSLIGGEIVHARVFQPLPHTGQAAQLHSVDQEKHTVESDIGYF